MAKKLKIRARFGGSCERCGAKLAVGDEVLWTPGVRGVRCSPSCAAKAQGGEPTGLKVGDPVSLTTSEGTFAGTVRAVEGPLARVEFPNGTAWYRVAELTVLQSLQEALQGVPEPARPETPAPAAETAEDVVAAVTEAVHGNPTVVLQFDGDPNPEWTGDLLSFLRDNEHGPEEEDEIRAALGASGVWTFGGGAAPSGTLRMASPVVHGVAEDLAAGTTATVDEEDVAATEEPAAGLSEAAKVAEDLLRLWR